MRAKRYLIIFLVSFFSPLFAQEVISYNGSGNYILIEKTDLRRYDNGKYTGLVSREVSSYITPVAVDDGYYYEGSFFINQDTVHSQMYVDTSINTSIPAAFKINSDGNLKMVEDHGFPSFRSFPSYSVNKIQKGDKWQAKAERAVDPLFKGVVTKMPMYVEYQYIGDTEYHGEPCYTISAQWATRYGMGTGNYYIDWGGDKELTKAVGSHKATIYVSKYSGNALVIRDTVDETFVYADGLQVQFKGNISQFTEYPPAIDRNKLIPALKRIASISAVEEDALKQRFPLKQEENSLSPIEIATTATATATTTATATAETENKISSLPNAASTTQIEANTATTQIEAGASTDSTASIATASISNSLVTVDNTPAGIRLTIPNLQFKPDSAELLGTETNRLDQIASVLKEVPECKLLIEGYTAAVGKEQGELQLSKERANAIAQALIKRGINADRIICKGSGGKKPIADNSTAEGKAKNRRVEITILE